MLIFHPLLTTTHRWPRAVARAVATSLGCRAAMLRVSRISGALVAELGDEEINSGQFRRFQQQVCMENPHQDLYYPSCT